MIFLKIFLLHSTLLCLLIMEEAKNQQPDAQMLVYEGRYCTKFQVSSYVQMYRIKYYLAKQEANLSKLVPFYCTEISTNILPFDIRALLYIT